MVLPSKFSVFQSVFDKLCVVLRDSYGLTVSKSKFSGMESFVSPYFFYEIDLCDSNITVSCEELSLNLITRVNSKNFGGSDAVNTSIVFKLCDDEGEFIIHCSNALDLGIDKLKRLHKLNNLQLSLSGVCSNIGVNLELNYTYLYLDSGSAFAFDLCSCFIYCIANIDGSYSVYKVENKTCKRLDFKTFEFNKNNSCVKFILLKEGNFSRQSTGVLYEEVCNVIEVERKSIKDRFIKFSDSIIAGLKSKGNVISASINCKDWLTVIKCNKYQLVYDGYSIKWCEIIPRPKLLCDVDSGEDSVEKYIDTICELFDNEDDI